MDSASEKCQYMDEEVLITSAGGSCAMDEEGVRQQKEDQTYDSAHIAVFERNMREMVPIGIIFGKPRSIGSPLLLC